MFEFLWWRLRKAEIPGHAEVNLQESLSAEVDEDGFGQASDVVDFVANYCGSFSLVWNRITQPGRQSQPAAYAVATQLSGKCHRQGINFG